jgi:hypothetical protein
MSDSKNNTKDASNISLQLESVLQKEQLKYEYEKSDQDDTAYVFHVQRHEEQFNLVVRADIPLVQIVMVWYLSDMFDKDDECFILHCINLINENMPAKLFYSITYDEEVERLSVTAIKEYYWLPDIPDINEDFMGNMDFVERLKRLFGISILEEKLTRTGQEEVDKPQYDA